MAGKEIVEVGVDTSEELIVKYDEDGQKLKFDHKNFKRLTTKTIKSLKKINREAYHIAKGYWEEENDVENGEVFDDMKISPENMRMFTTSKLNVGVRKGLEKHFARPDKMERYQALGYKVAGKGDLENPREIDKATVDINGYRDVTLMVRPTEVAAGYRKEQREYNTKLLKGEATGQGIDGVRGNKLPVTSSEVSAMREE